MAEEKRTKEQLKALAEKLTSQYNEAVQNGKYDVAAKLNNDIKETVNEYTAIAKDECFSRLMDTENPMLEAVKELSFMTIRAFDHKAGDEKITVRAIVDSEKYIDLFELHKAADGIGVNKSWIYVAEKLNFLLTAQKAVDLGISPKEINDSYEMSDISKQINLGKTPTSKTNILKTLQLVVTSMIGEEYKATSHDVNFLMSIYSRKKRKALTVSCTNHRYLRQYLAEICHRIVLDKKYELDYRKISK